jgi:hypothetical protein
MRSTRAGRIVPSLSPRPDLRSKTGCGTDRTLRSAVPPVAYLFVRRVERSFRNKEPDHTLPPLHRVEQGPKDRSVSISRDATGSALPSQSAVRVPTCTTAHMSRPASAPWPSGSNRGRGGWRKPSLRSRLGSGRCGRSQCLVTKQIPPAVLSCSHSWSASFCDPKGPTWTA